MKKKLFAAKMIWFLMAGFSSVILITSSCKLEAQSTYYIDPSISGSGGSGTIEQPYKSWLDVQWTEGASYLQKRGTVFETSKSVLVRAKNINIGAYGDGPKPIIRDVSTESFKILDVYQQGNFSISNFEIESATKVASTCVEFKANENIYIDSCVFHGADWGIRFLFNKGLMKIDRSVVYDTYDDGIYIKDNAPGEGEYSLRDSVHIQYSHVYDVNRGHYEDPNSWAGGDCVQLDDISGYYINNNILDRSLTDIKFCLITGECGFGLVEDNHFIGFGPGMSNFYVHKVDKLIVRYNVFENATYGIFNSSGKNVDVLYNIFKDIDEVAYSANQNDGSHSNVLNNLFINTDRAIIAWKSINIYNNIFYNISGTSIYGSDDITSDNNCYYMAEPRSEKNSVLSSPEFMNVDAGDYRLKEGSPCIDKGRLNEFATRDMARNKTPYNGITDIGLYEWINKKDASYTNHFEILSNPAEDGFTISTNSDTVVTDIMIYDSFGRLLYSLYKMSISETPVDINLPKGIIIIKFHTENGFEESHKLAVL